MVPRLPIQKISRRWRVLRKAIRRSVFPNRNEPRRITVGKWAHQNCIGDAKDSGVRCYAESEYGHGKCRKSRALAQNARGIFQILPSGFEKADAVHAIDLLADESWIAQLSPRRVARLFRRHAPCDVLVCFDLQIRFELTRLLFIPGSTPKKTLPCH